MLNLDVYIAQDMLYYVLKWGTGIGYGSYEVTEVNSDGGGGGVERDSEEFRSGAVFQLYLQRPASIWQVLATPGGGH